MSSNNARTWSLTLIGACILSLMLGLSLGYALFGPGDLPWATQTAEAPVEELVPDEPETPTELVAEDSEPVAPPEPPPEPVWSARHLFIALNGQWVADGTKEFLKEIRPGGVILRDVNLRSRSQTVSLVQEIKAASDMGGEVYDLPLVGVAQEGGNRNLLGLENAPDAAQIADFGTDFMAEDLGRLYAEEALARGIGVVLAPVLDIYEDGGIYPNMAARSFGSDQKAVTSLGLAMAAGLRSGGVVPVAKHFPGYGMASFGSDGITVVLNKDVSGLARGMYPFNEAVRRNIEGLIIGHVAVPALDKDNPERSAALSPVIINELLRQRWGYDGVVIADEIALNEMMRMGSVEEAVVAALKAGCDAVLFLDPNPNNIRAACAAIEQAVWDGELSREQLETSRERLDEWRAQLGADLTPEPEPVIVAEAQEAPAEPEVEPEPSEAGAPEVDVAPETPNEPNSENAPVEPEAVPEIEDDSAMVVAQASGESEPKPVEAAPVEAPEELSIPDAPEPDSEPEAEEADPAETVPQVLPQAPPMEEEAQVDAESAPEPDAETEAGESAEPKLSEADRMILAQAAEQLLADMQEDEPAKVLPPDLPLPDVVESSETEVVLPTEMDAPEAEVSEPEAEEPAPDAATPTPTEPDSEADETPDIPEEESPELPEPVLVAEADTTATPDVPMETEPSVADSEESLPEETSLEPESSPEAEPEPASEETPGPADAPAEMTEDAVEEDLSIMTHLRHEVKFGETLLQISWYYGVEVDDIVQWNDLTVNSVDHGDMLDIYVAPDVEPDEIPQPDRMAEAVAEETAAESEPEPEVEEPTPESETEQADAPIVHTVVAGDTLLSLARTHNVTVDQIKDWNNLESDVLRLDAELTIHPGQPQEAPPAPDVPTVIHEVVPGDTLTRIAGQYATTGEVILRLNGLDNPNHVWVGQKLKVPAQE